MNTTVQTGLLERLQAKATLNLPVEQTDVIELIEIVNHNAFVLNDLKERFLELTEQTKVGFSSMNESMNVHDECIEKLANVCDNITDQLSTVDSDINGVYDDLNEIAPSILTENGTYERDSYIETEVEEGGVVEFSLNAEGENEGESLTFDDPLNLLTDSVVVIQLK